MFFSDAPVGNCLHWNAIVEVPMYIRGDMCLDNYGDSDPITGWPPASLPGAAQLQVGGTISITPSGHLGWSGAHLNIVQTGVGCKYNGGTLHNPCNSSDAISANQYLTGTASLTKPVIDLAGWYTDSLPGPLHNCTSGSFPGGFDNDTTQNNSNGTINLTPAGAYDCIFASGGAVQGEIKWTPGTPGTLQIYGTVFFDGNLVMGTSFNYTGRGDPLLRRHDHAQLRGQRLRDQRVHRLMGHEQQHARPRLRLREPEPELGTVNLAATSVFQGAIECVGDVTQNGTNTTGSTVWGGLIAHQIYNLSPNDKWQNFNLPAAGQPGTTNVTESLTPVASSFSG